MPTRPRPPTSQSRPGTPGCDASSTWAASCPTDEALSEHLTSRAEVAEALTVEDGPELVWLGAAMIIGAGSTSFEMMRYVGDRFPLMPIPNWMDNPIDPISIRDVLHYLVAAADPARVPAGAYDISGPTTTSYRELLKTYARISGRWHAALPVGRVDTGLASLITGVALPVPQGLAEDLVESLDHPMVASVSGLRDRVPDPPGGLLDVGDAVAPGVGRVRAPAQARQRDWPIRISSPTAIPPGQVAMPCESAGSPGRLPRRSSGPRSDWSTTFRARSPVRCEPASTSWSP